MDPIVSYLLGQLNALGKVFVPFLLAAILVGFTVFYAVRAWFSGQMATLNQRLALRDDQLASLQKDKPHLAASAEALPESPPIEAIHNAPSALSGKPFLEHGFRLGSLSETYRGRTQVQADAAVKPYIGKWVKIEGIVKNVSDNKAFWTVLLRDEKDSWPLTLCYFRSSYEHLEALSLGQKVVIAGEIERVDRTSASLEKCELLQA